MSTSLRSLICLIILLALVCSLSLAQETGATVSVPRLISYSGIAKDVSGKPITGPLGVTFALYKEEAGGAPVWLETQSVQADAKGHYIATLGAAQSNGLPLEVFTNTDARWLGVQIEGQAEQPRTLLLSVPYALKAGDAQTIGGLPPSAFVLAAPPTASSTTNAASPSAAISSPAGSPLAVGGGGTLNFVPLWTPDGSTLGNSVLFQSGSGSTAKVGINTTTPSTTLDVKGAGTVRGVLALPAIGNATASAGKNSQPVKLTASAFNSGTNAAVNQNFQWQAEPASNNTSNPSGTMNLLYSSGSGQSSETGLKISSTGVFTFASGQTFPGAGTITGVTAGTALTGGGTTGSITLGLDTTQVPQLNVGNTFTGNQTVNGNLSATGVVTGSSYQIGSSLFAFGSLANSNAFLGFSGNSSMSGQENTANGALALLSNTSGQGNTANGYQALVANTTGGSNTANGLFALEGNTTGSNNTASGSAALQSNTTGLGNTADGAAALTVSTQGNFNTASGNGALAANTTGSNNSASGSLALSSNTTGSNNTALGYNAGPDSSHPNLTNATAIGANAVVSQSNALVLGGTGSNAVDVGIGTATPAATLDVQGTGNFTGLITFAAGQTFPGTGTITNVTAGTDLIGGGSSGSVTLNVDTTKVVTAVSAGADLLGGGTGGVQTLSLDTTKVPLLAAANTFTNSQTVSGNLTATGVVSGSSYQIGSSLFAFGNYLNRNAFLGFAGNATTTGTYNTATGFVALVSDTTGSSNTATGGAALENNTTGGDNTASGDLALLDNTTGSDNTASGGGALYFNTTGSSNTATGSFALTYNTTGSNNTSLGYLAGPDQPHGNLTNATAIGAFSQVTASNSLVLGSINGLNGATADTLVGIGTPAPSSTLDVEGTAAAASGPILLLKNKAGVQSGVPGNAIDIRFAPDGGSSVSNPNAYIRVTEDGNSQYGAFMSFATMADGGAGSGAIERMRIAANGNIGIGTASPDALLSVNGGADKAGGGSWGTFSDGRLKNLNGDFRSGLSEILKLHPIRYRYKEENAMGIRDHDEHIGFVAQDVQKVIPEAVTENSRGYLLVNNDPILWAMLNAIQQQQREIEDLREQLQKKASQQSDLEARLARLERQQDGSSVALIYRTSSEHGKQSVLGPPPLGGLSQPDIRRFLGAMEEESTRNLSVAPLQAANGKPIN